MATTPVWAFWVGEDEGVPHSTLTAPRFELALEPKFPSLTTPRYIYGAYGLWSINGTITTSALAARLIMQVNLPTESSRLAPSVIAAIHAKASILYMAATKFAVVEIGGTLALVRVTCLSPYKGYVKGTPGTLISFEEGSILLRGAGDPTSPSDASDEGDDPPPLFVGITALSDLTATETASLTATAATIFSRRTRLLPEDLLELTFRSLVPPELLVSCLSVCKTWRRVALRLLCFDSPDAGAGWSQCMARDAEELSASISVDMSRVVRSLEHESSDGSDVVHPIVYRAVLLHRLNALVARPASLQTLGMHDPADEAADNEAAAERAALLGIGAVLQYLVKLLAVQVRNLVRHITVATPPVCSSLLQPTDPAVAMADTVARLLYELLDPLRGDNRRYARKLMSTFQVDDILWVHKTVFLPQVGRGDGNRRMCPPARLANTLRAVISCAQWDDSLERNRSLVTQLLRGVLWVAQGCRKFQGRTPCPLAVIGILNVGGFGPFSPSTPRKIKKKKNQDEVEALLLSRRRVALETRDLAVQSLFAIDFAAFPFEECVSALRVLENEYVPWFVRALDLLECHPALPSITTGHTLESDLDYICSHLGQHNMLLHMHMKAECDLEDLQRVEVHIPSRLRSILGRLSNIRAAVYIAAMLAMDIAKPGDLEHPMFRDMRQLSMTRYAPKVRHTYVKISSLARVFVFTEEEKEDAELDAGAEEIMCLMFGVCRRDTDVVPLLDDDFHPGENAAHLAARAMALRECGMSPWLSGDAFKSQKPKNGPATAIVGLSGHRGDNDRYLLGHWLGQYVSLLELLTERVSNVRRTQFLIRECLLNPLARLEVTIGPEDLRLIVVGIGALVKCPNDECPTDERVVPAIRHILRTLAQGVIPPECELLAVAVTALVTRFWLDEEHRQEGFSLTCPECGFAAMGGWYLAKYRRTKAGRICVKCQIYVGPRLLRYEPGYVTRVEVLAVLRGFISKTNQRTNFLALQVFERLVELGDTDGTEEGDLVVASIIAGLHGESADVQLRLGASVFTASPSPDSLLRVLQLLRCNSEREPLLCLNVYAVMFNKMLLGEDVARGIDYNEEALLLEDEESQVNVRDLRAQPWAGAVTGSWVRPLYEGMRSLGFLTDTDENADEAQRTQKVLDCLFSLVIVDAMCLSDTLMRKQTEYTVINPTLEAILSLVHRMCAFLARVRASDDDFGFDPPVFPALFAHHDLRRKLCVDEALAEHVVGTLLLGFCERINAHREDLLDCDYKRKESPHQGHFARLMRLLFNDAVYDNELIWESLRTIREPLNMALMGYTGAEDYGEEHPNAIFFLPQLVLTMEGDLTDEERNSYSLNSLPGVSKVMRWWLRKLTACYKEVFRKLGDDTEPDPKKPLDRIRVQLMLMSQPNAKAIDRALEYLDDYLELAEDWEDNPVLAETRAAASELRDTSWTYRRISDRVVAEYRRARGMNNDDDTGSENGENVPDA